MSSFVVVLDACVLIPAPLRDTLLRTAAAGLYRLQWTVDILEEVQRNLISEIGIPEDKAQRLIDIMSKQFPEAFISHHKVLIESMPNHPKDRHVLAAAVASRAQVIITQNLRDFPQVTLAPFEVEAQSPDDFLTHLFYLAPERMAEIIKEQAADLHNPPKSVTQLLETLAQHTPEFAKLIRKELDNNTKSVIEVKLQSKGYPHLTE